MIETVISNCPLFKARSQNKMTKSKRERSLWKSSSCDRSLRSSGTDATIGTPCTRWMPAGVE